MLAVDLDVHGDGLLDHRAGLVIAACVGEDPGEILEGAGDRRARISVHTALTVEQLAGQIDGLVESGVAPGGLRQRLKRIDGLGVVPTE